MQWAFLTAGTIAMVELFLRLPVLDKLRQIRVVVRKVLKTVSSKAISDHWKERVLLAYSGKLLVCSLSLFALLLLALSPLAVLCAIGIRMQVPLLALLMDYRGVLASIIAACAYLAVRNRLKYV
jgi:hypothetical protein